MKTLAYNGVQSSAHGVYVSGVKSYNAPGLDFTATSVPGRSGDLIVSGRRYGNITVEYPAICRGFADNRQAVRNWLLTPQGYCRLTDEYDDAHFRMGIFSGGVAFDAWASGQTAELSLKFNCKPQRFLTSGETAVTIISSGTTVSNTTPFNSRPLVQIYGTAGGSGTVSIHGDVITVSSITNGMMVDCETLDAYNGATNLNGDISVTDFPELKPGSNTITFTGAVSSVKITPRWWEL